MEITNQMKVLLISDVHGNLPALDAVLNQASYDRVLFMSDAVDYGHFPFEVYSRLYQIRATRVLGNHDVAASFGIDCQSPPEMHELPLLPEKRSPQKNACQRGQRKHFARKLSERMFLEYDGLRLLMAHGSPSDELYQSISKEAAENLVEPSADLVLLGHTHVLYEVNNGSTWVVNPGSVGMPRDDNPRPLYAILDTHDRAAHFERAEYDPEPMLSKLQQLLANDMKIYEFLADIFRTGRESQS